MTWNYRIIRHHEPEPWLGLHEVYYDEHGQPQSYTENPTSFVCDDDETPDGIIKALRRALADAEQRPVLDVKEFKQASSSS